MAKVNGEAGFTQLAKLNITDEILLKGVPISGGSLPVDNFTGGFFDYNDDGLATIAHTGGNDTPLTNNENGASTNKTYPPLGVTDVWDEVGNVFDWSQLSLGDMVDIRLDIEVTTSSVNQEITIELELAQGGSSYRIPFIHLSYKSAGAKKVGAFTGVYMGDTNTINNPGQFIFTSTDNATIKINGWYCKVIKMG